MLNALLEEHASAVQAIFIEDRYVRGKKNFLSLLFALGWRAGVRLTAISALETSAYWLFLRLKSLFGISRLQPLSVLVRKLQVPVFHISHANDEGFRAMLAKLAPDIVLLIDCGTIVKEPTIKIPRLAMINFHPEILPRYKGLFNTFHALRRAEKSVGVTMHVVNPAIDEGDIVDQEIIAAHPRETLAYHNLEKHELADRLMRRVVARIVKTGMVTSQSQATLEKGAYFKWPTKDEVNQFRATGRRFLSFKDFVRIWRFL